MRDAHIVPTPRRVCQAPGCSKPIYSHRLTCSELCRRARSRALRATASESNQRDVELGRLLAQSGATTETVQASLSSPLVAGEPTLYRSPGSKRYHLRFYVACAQCGESQTTRPRDAHRLVCSVCTFPGVQTADRSGGARVEHARMVYIIQGIQTNDHSGLIKVGLSTTNGHRADGSAAQGNGWVYATVILPDETAKDVEARALAATAPWSVDARDYGPGWTELRTSEALPVLHGVLFPS